MPEERKWGAALGKILNLYDIHTISDPHFSSLHLGMKYSSHATSLQAFSSSADVIYVSPHTGHVDGAVTIVAGRDYGDDTMDVYDDARAQWSREWFGLNLSSI